MNDFALDDILDAAVLEGALVSGRDPLLAAHQFGVSRVIAAGGSAGRPRWFGNVWPAADDEKLRAWAGELGTADIAARLGRTAAAVETRRFTLGLPAPMTNPEYVTGQAMADALGVDGHAVLRLVERGILPVERTPLASERVVWRMRRTAFYVWATRPENWVYFVRSVREPERITDERLRRLIVRRAAVWGDEWWSIGEVARYHNADHQLVNKYIRGGRLPAVKWGNWWVKRSEATRPGFRIWRWADGMLYQRGTPAADGFLVLATAVGLPSSHISRMMAGTLSDAGVVTRYRTVVERGLVPWLARVYDLPVRYRAEAAATRPDGTTWADWRECGGRFPALARAWARMEAGRPLDRHERAILAGVCRSFLRFHAPDNPLLRRVGRGDASAVVLREIAALFPARAEER